MHPWVGRQLLCDSCCVTAEQAPSERAGMLCFEHCLARQGCEVHTTLAAHIAHWPAHGVAANALPQQWIAAGSMQ
jgi:hypothetical protein